MVAERDLSGGVALPGSQISCVKLTPEKAASALRYAVRLGEWALELLP